MKKLAKSPIFLIMALTASASMATSVKTDPRAKLLGKKITKPNLPFVDAEGIWSNPGDGDGNGNGFGDLSSGNSGNGRGKIGLGQGTEFTNPNGSGAGAGDGSGNKNGGGRGGGDQGGLIGSKVSNGGQIEVHEKWWPLCLFADQKADEATVNAAIKEQIEMANRCKVNLVVWAKTTESSTLPDDFETVNKNTVAACNLPPELASAGSSSAFVMHPLTAAKMCDVKKEQDGNPGLGPEDFDPDVAGCAQLRSGVSKEQSAMMQNKEGEGSKTGVAPSIEVPKGHSGSVLAHESQGHSQFGMPNGSALGNGIGTWEELAAAKKRGEEPPHEHGGGDWNGAGCAKMRETALPNDRKFGFDPSRETYYVKPTSPDAIYKLGIDPPIFGPIKPVVGGGQAVPPLNTPPSSRITMVDTPKGQVTPPVADPKKQETAKIEDDTPKTTDVLDARHKKRGSAVNALLESAAEAEGEKLEGLKPRANPPPNGPPLKPGPRIGFDDNAPKGRSVTKGGATVTSAEAPPENIYSGDIEVSDTPRTTQEPTMSGSGGGSSGGGSGSGATITFDDNAPKGGLSGGALTGVGNRGPTSVEAAADAAAAARIAGAVRAGAGSSFKASWDEEEDFFDEVGEDGEPKKRKKKVDRRRPGLEKGGRRPASIERPR